MIFLYVWCFFFISDRFFLLISGIWYQKYISGIWYQKMSYFLYQECEFLISKIIYFDIRKSFFDFTSLNSWNQTMIFWYQEMSGVFFISDNFFYWYQEFKFWYQKMSYFLYQDCEFPISKIIFLISENLIHMYIICFQKVIFFLNNQILCIRNDIWYQKNDFLISENNRYNLNSRNRISDIIKSFSGIKIEYMISKIHFLISENTS